MALFSLSQFFSNLYTSTTLFFTLLLFDLAIPIQSAIQTLCTTTSTAHIRRRHRHLSSGQFLHLVEENIPRTLYTKGLCCPNDSSEVCSICLSNFEEGDEMWKLNSCEHRFHKECLDTWLVKQDGQGETATCPLCRRMVLPAELNDENNYYDDIDDTSEEESECVVYYFLSALHGNNYPLTAQTE